MVNSRHGFLIAAMVCGPVGAFIFLQIARAAAVPLPRTAISAAVLLQFLLVAPVLEELIFRGVLQGLLSDSRSGRPRFIAVSAGPLSLANLVTSVVFAASHLLSHPPLVAWTVILPSLIFGRLKEIYGSLLWPIVVHAWYNLVFLLVFGR